MGVPDILHYHADYDVLVSRPVVCITWLLHPLSLPFLQPHGRLRSPHGPKVVFFFSACRSLFFFPHQYSSFFLFLSLSLSLSSSFFFFFSSSSSSSLLTSPLLPSALRIEQDRGDVARVDKSRYNQVANLGRGEGRNFSFAYNKATP